MGKFPDLNWLRSMIQWRTVTRNIREIDKNFFLLAFRQDKFVNGLSHHLLPANNGAQWTILPHIDIALPFVTDSASAMSYNMWRMICTFSQSMFHDHFTASYWTPKIVPDVSQEKLYHYQFQVQVLHQLSHTYHDVF